MIHLFNENCFEGLKRIPDDSIDCIISDPPYNVLDCHWDAKLDFVSLWREFLRISKITAAICLFSSGLFTENLIRNSPKDLFRYKWVWVKNTVTNFIQAKHRPMSKHEDILVFSKGTTANGSKRNMNYFPQGVKKLDKPHRFRDRHTGTVLHTTKTGFVSGAQEFTGYPNDILVFDSVQPQKKMHTSQKPVTLLEYLVKTYTLENDSVLDPFAGSASTAIACMNTNRNFIGFELDIDIFNTASKRIADHELNLFNGVTL